MKKTSIAKTQRFSRLKKPFDEKGSYTVGMAILAAIVCLGFFALIIPLSATSKYQYRDSIEEAYDVNLSSTNVEELRFPAQEPTKNVVFGSTKLVVDDKLVKVNLVFFEGEYKLFTEEDVELSR